MKNDKDFLKILKKNLKKSDIGTTGQKNFVLLVNEYLDLSEKPSTKADTQSKINKIIESL